MCFFKFHFNLLWIFLESYKDVVLRSSTEISLIVSLTVWLLPQDTLGSINTHAQVYTYMCLCLPVLM